MPSRFWVEPGNPFMKLLKPMYVFWNWNFKKRKAKKSRQNKVFQDITGKAFKHVYYLYNICISVYCEIYILIPKQYVFNSWNDTVYNESACSVFEGCSGCRGLVTDIVHSTCYSTIYQSAGSLVHPALNEYKRAPSIIV